MSARAPSRAPRVVAIGGGHGLAQTLKAVRRYAGELTAVVSVADDGGSSGRLRELLGIPAPGDLRRCLSALLPEGSPLVEALEHRFGSGALAGHAFGNLFIAAMALATGDFVSGVEEAGRVLGAVGRVLPATELPVVLKAQTAGGEIIGQVRVMTSDEIATVSLVPPDPAPPPAVIEAIAGADQIVLGPGSLFTSVLAACVVPADPRGPACGAGKVCLCREPARADARDSRFRRLRPARCAARARHPCRRGRWRTRPRWLSERLPDDISVVVARHRRERIQRARPEVARGAAFPARRQLRAFCGGPGG